MKRGAQRYWSIEAGAGLLALAFAGGAAFAQAPIGSVALADAVVVGSPATESDRAVLLGNVTVTAKDRVAYVELFRGGSVKVCATSGLHLTAGSPVIEHAAPAADSTTDVTAPSSPQFPLMLALDRGAVELHMSAISSDVLMTPDLHIAFSEAGPLDLRIRVTRNGDTCVENRVTGLSHHPILHIGSMFGNDNYDVLPGQHVLFEGGNLHEVVDNESSPCGCPEQSAKPAAPVGEISLLGAPKAAEKEVPAVQYPFPAAVSQGLEPPPPAPKAPAGVTHTQVATSLVFKGDAPPDTATAPSAPAAPTTVAAPVASSPPPPKPGFFESIGRFFKRLFGK